MLSKSFSLLIATALSVSTIQAAEVWSDTFSTNRGSAPNPYDFTGTGGADYNVVGSGVVYTANGTSGVLNINDTGTIDATPQVTVALNQFTPTSYTGAQITLSYDIRVNGLTAVTPASAPRFSILSGPSTGNVEVFTIGFSHAAFSGAAAGGDALGFYYVNGAAGTTIDTNRGIGVNVFNFGTYSSTTATDNDTNRGGGNQFFRITLAITQGLTAVTGTITDLGTNTSVSIPAGAALSSALNWGANPTSDGFRITTGLSGTSNYDLDNISVNVVPEPSSAVLAGFGVIGLLARRRRA